MALVPKLQFCLNNSCSELVVSETTGAYNALTNTGGYGAPNPELVEVQGYTLTITDPDDVTYTIDLFATAEFPTDDSTIQYTIPMSQLGNRTVIEDGYWQFSWTVTGLIDDFPNPGINFTASGNSASYFTCNAECCVSALLAKIDIDEDECNCNDNSKNIMNYLKAKAFLESLRNAAFCGNLTLFNTIQAAITKLCNKTDCKTCN
jgi:hypothetical protein